MKIYWEQPKKIERKTLTQSGQPKGKRDLNLMGTPQKDQNGKLNSIETNPWRRKLKSTGNYPKISKQNSQLNWDQPKEKEI